MSVHDRVGSVTHYSTVEHEARFVENGRAIIVPLEIPSLHYPFRSNKSVGLPDETRAMYYSPSVAPSFVEVRTAHIARGNALTISESIDFGERAFRAFEILPSDIQWVDEARLTLRTLTQHVAERIQLERTALEHAEQHLWDFQERINGTIPHYHKN